MGKDGKQLSASTQQELQAPWELWGMLMKMAGLCLSQELAWPPWAGVWSWPQPNTLSLSPQPSAEPDSPWTWWC